MSFSGFFIHVTLFSLASLILILMHFAYERLKATDYFLQTQINKTFMYVIDGVFYGLLILLIEYLTNAVYSDFAIPFYLVGMLTICIIKTFEVASIALLLSLFVWIPLTTIGIDYYFYIGSLFLTIIQVRILKWFNFKKGLIGWSSAITFSALIGISVMVLVFIYDFSFSSLVPTLFYLPISFIVFFFQTIYFINVSFSANLLNESFEYVFSNYYRESLQEIEIGHLIERERPEHAFYGVMKFNIESETNGDVSSEEYEEVMESILLDFERFANEQSILFKCDADHYGFFLPFDYGVTLEQSLLGNRLKEREPYDMLARLDLLLHKIPHKYITRAKRHFNVQVLLGVSLYGVQSNSVSELYQMASYALKMTNINRYNNIYLHENKSYKRRLRDRQELNLLDEMIDFDDYENVYMQIASEKLDENIFFVEQSTKSVQHDYNDLQKHKIEIGMNDTFDRYFASIALNAVNEVDRDARVATIYSPLIFQDDFNIYDYIQNVESRGTKIGNIISVFTSTELNLITDAPATIRSAKQVIKNGGAFAIYVNDNTALPEWVSKIKIEFIFTRNMNRIEEIMNEFKRRKVVAICSDEKQMEQAKSLGVEYFAGRQVNRTKMPLLIKKK